MRLLASWLRWQWESLDSKVRYLRECVSSVVPLVVHVVCVGDPLDVVRGNCRRSGCCLRLNLIEVPKMLQEIATQIELALEQTDY